MIITKSELQQIIKEEVEQIFELKKLIVRKGKKRKKDITMATVMKNKRAFLMNPKRRRALKKARRKAHTSLAKTHKKKSMNIRKRYRK